MLTHSSANVRTVIDSYSDTYIVRDGDRYIVAEPDMYCRGRVPDWCSPNAVRVERFLGAFNLKIVECCEFCKLENKDLISFMDKWEEFFENEDDSLDSDEFLENLLETYSPAIVTEDYHGTWHVRNTTNVTSGDFLIFDGADRIANYWASELNGNLWCVGSIPVADVEDLEELRADDCPDIVGGFVWDNVDDYGDSTPTETELRNAL